MKVALVSPNSFSMLKDFLDVCGPPLGLGYIASYLREHGEHTVKVIDSLTLNYSNQQIASEIEAFNPEVVGVSFFSTPMVYDAMETTREIKKRRNDLFIVAGGVHVTFAARQTLWECNEIDVVVRGEGEKIMLNLLNNCNNKEKCCLKRIKGITFRENKEIIETPPETLVQNLDSLPFPAFDLLPMDKYRLGKKRFATMITSRGCPFKCIYCSSSRLYGSKWRCRSPMNIIQEILLLKKRYGIDEIEFLDDNFMLNPSRAEKIAEKIREENIKISWTCSSRVDTISRFPRILKKLKDAGCHAIYVGVESGSQKVLDFIGKKINLSQARKAIKAIKEAGIDSVASFILGFPCETRKDMEKTVKFALELDPTYVQFTLATPYPGTPLYEKALKERLLLERDWRKYDVLTPVLKVEGISPRELTYLLRKAYMSFYMRPKFLLTQLRKRNFFLFKKILKAFVTYVKEEFSWIVTKSPFK